MSYISLPLNPRNDFASYYADNKYTYLVINKIEKPVHRNKKTEDNYHKWENQQETLKRLETGHYNCYNVPIEACNIVNELKWIIESFDHYIIYKIKPNSTHYGKTRHDNLTKWEFFEFDVVKKFDNIGCLYKSLYEDHIMNEVVAHLIDNCNDSQHVAEWDNIWTTIKTAVPDVGEHIYFSDVVHYLKNYAHNTAKIRDNILYKLMKTNDIVVTSIYDANYTSLLKSTFAAKLYKSMHHYTFCKLKTTKDIQLSPQDIEMLQQHTDDANVADIAKILEPKFPGMTLIVKKTEYFDDRYASHNSQEEVAVKDVNEAKTYIVRNFDIDFAELQKNVESIHIHNGDVEYEFELRSE